MGSKIYDITRRLNDISSRRNKFGLDKVAAINQLTCERPLMTSPVSGGSRNSERGGEFVNKFFFSKNISIYKKKYEQLY